MRVDTAGNETNIGTNSATYVPVEADVGNTIKVKVSFDDAKGTSEGPLTSTATAMVAASDAGDGDDDGDGQSDGDSDSDDAGNGDDDGDSDDDSDDDSDGDSDDDSDGDSDDDSDSEGDGDGVLFPDEGLGPRGRTSLGHSSRHALQYNRSRHADNAQCIKIQRDGPDRPGDGYGLEVAQPEKQQHYKRHSALLAQRPCQSDNELEFRTRRPVGPARINQPDDVMARRHRRR